MIPQSTAYKRELVFTCFGAFTSFVVLAMAGPLTPLMALELGASPTMIGLLIGLANLGALLAAIPTGLIARRLGTRPLLVWSSLLIGGSCLLIFRFPSLMTLSVGYALFGVGRTVATVSAQVHVGGIEGTTDVSRNFGWYGAAAASGMMVGPAASGWLMDSYGKPETWLVMALISALTAIAFATLIGSGRQTESPSESPSEGRGRLTDLVRRLFTSTAFLGILASFIIIFAMGARMTFFPVFLSELGYSASLIGLMISARGFVSVFARMSVPHAIRLVRSRSRLMVFCFLMLAAGLGSIPLCTTVPLILVNAVVIGVGLGLAMPLSQTIVFDSAEVSMRAPAMGVRMTGNRLAQMVGPLLFGVLAESIRMAGAFMVAGAVLLVISVPIIVWAIRSPDPP